MNKPIKPCVCKNCGLLCYDNFCPRCGQKTDTDRLTFRSMARGFAAAIVGGENGLTHTIVQLFSHPNRLISNYINGKRKNYFAPFPLLFLALAVCLVVLQIATVDWAGALENFDMSIVKDADKATAGRLLQRTRAIYTFFFRYFTLISVLLAPILIIGVRICLGSAAAIRLLATAADRRGAARCRYVRHGRRIGVATHRTEHFGHTLHTDHSSSPLRHHTAIRLFGLILWHANCSCPIVILS